MSDTLYGAKVEVRHSAAGKWWVLVLINGVEDDGGNAYHWLQFPGESTARRHASRIRSAMRAT